MKTSSLIIAAVLIFGLSPSGYSATGAKIGFYLPQGMTVDHGSVARDFDTDPGISIGLFTEFGSGRVAISPFIDYTSFVNGADDGITLIDIGVDVKTKSAGTFDFGAGIGYGKGSLDPDPSILFVTVSDNDFLLYRAFVETRLSFARLEFGLKGYSGGNEEDVYINAGPYVRAILPIR